MTELDSRFPPSVQVPASLASDALVSFDEDVRQCFVLSSAIEVSDTAWKQAQLSLRFGGLGLRSLSSHAAAAFNSSLSSSGLGKLHNLHLQQTVTAYNSTKSPLITQSRAEALRNLKAALCPPHPLEHDKAIKSKVSSLKRKLKVREKANFL